MESVDKLREAARLLEVTGMRPNLYEIADAIESEVAERYMRLPVDADGEPIRVGDELETAHGGKVVVEYIGECEVRVYRDGEYHRISQDEYAYTCRHVKPYTIEDVLREFINDECVYTNETIAKYAERIREVLRDE